MLRTQCGAETLDDVCTMAIDGDNVAAAVAYGRHPMEMAEESERQRRAPPSAQPRVHVLSCRRLPDASALFLPPVDSNEEALGMRRPFPTLPVPCSATHMCALTLACRPPSPQSADPWPADP